MNASFEDAVIKTIKGLRRGAVASYGEIAQEAGFPGAARAVGNILSRSEGLPWWRVVRADGRLVARHGEEQRARLEKEGVRVVAGKVVLKRSR
jgi:methylated-DNA-protein-cysteine methyltransferase-like protein